MLWVGKLPLNPWMIELMPTSISLSCLKHQSRAPPEMYLLVGAVVGRGACGVPAMYSEADRQKFCSYCLVAKSCMTLLWPHGLYPARCLCPWNSPDWSGFPFPSPGDLPDRRIETTSLASPALEGGVFTTQSAGKTQTEGRTTGVDAAEFTSTLDFSRFVFATEVQLCELDYLPFLFFFLIFVYLAMLCLSGSLWDLASWPGIKPRSPALGAQS